MTKDNISAHFKTKTVLEIQIFKEGTAVEVFTLVCPLHSSRPSLSNSLLSLAQSEVRASFQGECKFSRLLGTSAWRLDLKSTCGLAKKKEKKVAA